jgi:hypothetical protein
MKKNTKRIRKEKVHSNTIYCNDIELIIEYIYNNTEGYSKAQIRDAVDSQFRMLKDITRSGGLINEESKYEDFKSIRLIRLGAFRPSEKKFEYIKEAVKKKKDDT